MSRSDPQTTLSIGDLVAAVKHGIEIRPSDVRRLLDAKLACYVTVLELTNLGEEEYERI